MYMLYQEVGVLIGIIAIILALLRFKNGKMSIGMLFLWAAIWTMVIFVSLFPNSTNIFASVTGIGRGLDLVLVLGLILGYYLIFKIYTMVENIDREITQLIREIAIQRADLKVEQDKHSKTDSNPQGEKDKVRSK